MPGVVREALCGDSESFRIALRRWVVQYCPFEVSQVSQGVSGCLAGATPCDHYLICRQVSGFSTCWQGVLGVLAFLHLFVLPHVQCVTLQCPGCLGVFTSFCFAHMCNVSHCSVLVS